MEEKSDNYFVKQSPEMYLLEQSNHQVSLEEVTTKSNLIL